MTQSELDRIEHGWGAYEEPWGRTVRKGFDGFIAWTRIYAEDGSSVKFGLDLAVPRTNQDPQTGDV